METKLNRRNFIKLSSGTVAFFALGLDNPGQTKGNVLGNVYDILGFPVQDASVTFVTGFSLSADDGLNTTSAPLAGPFSTNALGAFSLTHSNPKSDVALRVSYQNEVIQITTMQVTGTNIPFYNAEVWSLYNSQVHDTTNVYGEPLAEIQSRVATKWINELYDDGALSNLVIYIDPSRTYIKNYFSKNYSVLFNELKRGSHIEDDKEAWEGNHEDPDNPGHCNNEGFWDWLVGGVCDDHYYDPHLDGTKKINPPFGNGWGVIPFACAEGSVFHASDENDNSSKDGDWRWDIILEPQYAYLPNRSNQNVEEGVEVPREKEFALHCEMCNWFMGIKNQDPHTYRGTFTSISRNSCIKPFIEQRVWLTGSWTIDSGHGDFHNELHPVYWIVPFIGGWRRFYASEIIRVDPNANGAKSIIEEMLPSSPQSLLLVLSGLLTGTMYLKTSEAAKDFYAESLVHLNKFGLNSGFPNDANNAENSVNNADFQQKATNLSINQMTKDINNRYKIIYNHFTTLGSGFYVFPAMLFIYEGTDIIQQADAIGLHRPDSFITALYPSRIQVALGKQVLLFGDSFFENGLKLLQLAYQDIFNQMRLKSTLVSADTRAARGAISNRTVSNEAIADYYAKVSVRLISYGMYEDNDPKHSRNPQDHYNWALPRAKSGTQDLINSINVRLQDLWQDAFPFTRKYNNSS